MRWRRVKMKIKNLEVGDMVFIREDINQPEKIWVNRYDEPRLTGVQQIFKVIREDKCFEILGELDKAWANRNSYTAEMIDWEKTRDLKVNENWESIKKDISGDGTFKKITQFVEDGKEKTVALTNNGKEFDVTNNDEENDIEKAVMLLILKSLGVTYSEIKKEVEKVKIKWVPKHGEKYYCITDFFKVHSSLWEGCIWDLERLKDNNCFKTIEDANNKLKKIKEILKGE